MTLDNNKLGCCNKKRENNGAGCSRPSAPCCCCIIIMTGCCSKKTEERSSYEETPLQHPRKCVDVCKQGCCVTILCDGVRRKICLSIICSKSDAEGKKCYRVSVNECKRTTDGETRCCKSSSSGTRGNADCGDCVIETRCVNKTCCSKSSCCRNDNCTTTKKEVEKPCCNHSKNSCSRGVNCCMQKCCTPPDSSTDKLSSQITEKVDDESCTKDLKTSCCGDKSENCFSSKYCTSLCIEAGDTNKNTCCSKYICGIDDDCSKTKKGVEQPFCNDSKKSCCERENCCMPDDRTDKVRTSITKEGNEQSCCNEPKTRCIKIERENFCSNSKRCSPLDLKAEDSSCEIKQEYGKPCCEDSTCSCSGAEVTGSIGTKGKGDCCCGSVKVSTCCIIKVNCSTTCFDDCCHPKRFNIKSDYINSSRKIQECCEDEKVENLSLEDSEDDCSCIGGKPEGKTMRVDKNNCCYNPAESCQCLTVTEHCKRLCCIKENNHCCPDVVEVGCCNNSLQQRNCCKDEFTIKTGCCEVQIVCCAQKSCIGSTSANKDLQGTEKLCCSGSSLDCQGKCNEDCSCVHGNDQCNCYNNETTSVESSVKSKSSGDCEGRCCRTEPRVDGNVGVGENQCCCCKTSASVGGEIKISKDRSCQTETRGHNYSCYCLKKPLSITACCSISLTLRCCSITIPRCFDGCILKNSYCRNSRTVETDSETQKNCSCTTAGCSDKCDNTCGCEGND